MNKEYKPSFTTEKIFVFGSNTEGRHGLGSALDALLYFGAIYGQAEGLQGRSYAIVTKELRKNYPPVTLEKVAEGVSRFISFAKGNPSLFFYVTPIGTGLAGFDRREIFPLFEGNISGNIELSWRK